MSMIRIACPSCRSALKVPPRIAGMKVTCPKCKAPFVVPVPQAEILQPAPPPPPVRRAPVPPAPSPPPSSAFTFDAAGQSRGPTCPYCKQETAPGAAKCHHCGEFLRAPRKSNLVAFFLGLLLGPVGLWYKGHWVAGFAWMVMTIIFVASTGGCAAPFFWLGMAVHAMAATPKR